MMKNVFVSAKSRVDRRSFLRGSGALLALPWLDAMLPAFARASEAASATAAPKRLVAINYGLGIHAPNFFPEQEGEDYIASEYLKLIERHRKDFTVVAGLSHAEQNGQNGHSSTLTWLTGAKHPALPGFKNSISLDQLLVNQLRPDTRFPCLILGRGDGSLSWTSNGVQLPGHGSPVELFAKMFIDGSADEVEKQLHEMKRGRSVLDTVGGMARRFEKNLGPRDREKLDQYQTAVRELEERIQQTEGWATRKKPRVDAEAPKEIQDQNDIVARQRQMFELITLALQTDSTRIITCNMISGGGGVPTIEGVTEGHHPLSHHGLDPAKIAELALIESAVFREIDRFLAGMKEARDATGPILDQSTILLGSNLGNASSHSWKDLPVLVAGGGFRHGRYVVAGGKGNDNGRLGNLFVQIARHQGVEIDQFAGSTATSIQGLEA